VFRRRTGQHVSSDDPLSSARLSGLVLAGAGLSSDKQKSLESVLALSALAKKDWSAPLM
jgi:hypothetical protein